MTAPDELISLRYSSFRDFIESSSGRLSTEGMFIETDRPRPVGSPVSFELTVGHDFMLFRGTGEVASARDAATARGGAPGMAIRFAEVAYPGRRLLEKVVRKYEDDGVAPFSLKAGALSAGAATEPMQATPEEEAAVPSPADSGETTLEEFLRQDTPATDGSQADLDLFAARRPESDTLAVEPVVPEALLPEEAPPADSRLQEEALSETAPPEDLIPELSGDEVVESAPDEAASEDEGVIETPRLTLEELMAAASESARESEQDEWVPPPAEVEPPAMEPEPPAVESPVFQAPLPHEYRTGLSAEELAGSQSASDSGRSRRFGLPLVIVALLVVAAVTAWLFRDRLAGMFSGADEVSETAVSVEPAEESSLPPSGPGAGLAEGPDDSDAGPTEVTDGPSPEPSGGPVPVEPPVQPGSRTGATTATSASIADPAYTGVDSITWREESGTTVIVVRTNVAVSRQAITDFRIDEGRPREVMEIAGTKRPFAGGTVEIGGRHVLRIRTGYRSEDGGVLRLVADLTGPEIRLQSIAVEGADILITLAPPSAG